ncbi:MAG: rod shape-determining protein MreC, partial [Muribaculaceae bacterium]|nr:rod shape-determining protein MreC [Muribaculaceae bacterium]
MFVFYVVVSCVLLFSGNPYQHHVYLTSANTVSAGIYSVSNRFYSYFNLKEINDGLNERNAELQTRVLDLEQRLQDIQDRMDSDTLMTTESSQYEFVVAHVINNSISRTCNYLTINKGSADGIRPEMGVIDQTGVVGTVKFVAANSAR